MDAYTWEARFWKALAENKPGELPEPVNAKEYYMRLWALKQTGGYVSEDAVKAEAPAAETEHLGKTTAELVEDLAVTMDGNIGHVTGRAKYVTGFTEFSANTPELQEGHFVPIAITGSGSKMSLMKNGVVTKKDISFDNDLLFRVDPDETFGVILEDGKKTEFEFSGMTLEPKAD